MNTLRTIVWVLLAFAAGVAVLTFVQGNPHRVPVHFMKWRIEGDVPVWALVGCSALGGALLPKLVTFGSGWTRWRTRRRELRKLRNLEQEVIKLRNLPLRDLPALSRETPTARSPVLVRSAAALLEGGLEEEKQAYQAFLGRGQAMEPELLPKESADPYQDAFANPDLAVQEMEEAKLYPHVQASGRKAAEDS